MTSLPTRDVPSKAVRTEAGWLEAHWMPFTGNRQFKRDPRITFS